jgi:hypothetical protein
MVLHPIVLWEQMLPKSGYRFIELRIKCFFPTEVIKSSAQSLLILLTRSKIFFQQEHNYYSPDRQRFPALQYVIKLKHRGMTQ